MVLILSAPKHSAETMIEWYINCFITPYFIQHLVHAGFDLKNGKYLSCAGIENSAIVSKAKNFCISERSESGYRWTEKHRSRSFLPLQNQTVKNEVPFFHNCLVVNSDRENEITLSIPNDYKKSGIVLRSNRWNLEVSIYFCKWQNNLLYGEFCPATGMAIFIFWTPRCWFCADP